MTTLTAAQLDYVHGESGEAAAPYQVSDVFTQMVYDDAVLGASDLSRTIYFLISRRLALASALVDKSSEVDNLSVRSSQLFDHLKDLLIRWGGITGLGAQDITFGATSTFTYRADSLQTTEPTYDRGQTDLDWDSSWFWWP